MTQDIDMRIPGRSDAKSHVPAHFSPLYAYIPVHRNMRSYFGPLYVLIFRPTICAHISTHYIHTYPVTALCTIARSGAAERPVTAGRRRRRCRVMILVGRLLVRPGQGADQSFHDAVIPMLLGSFKGFFHPVVAGDDHGIAVPHELKRGGSRLFLPAKPLVPSFLPPPELIGAEHGYIKVLVVCQRPESIGEIGPVPAHDVEQAVDSAY